RAGELGLHLVQRPRRFGIAVALAVDVPPARAVRDVVQHARRTPARLRDRLFGSAGDVARAGQTLGPELGLPQLGTVPRHMRVRPAQPRQPAAVGTQPGRGEEVGTGDEFDRFTWLVGVDDHLAVDDHNVVDHLAVD